MSLNWIRTGLLDGAWKDPNKKMANCNHRQFFFVVFSMGFSEQKSDYHKGKDHQTGWCFFLPSQKPKEKTFSVPRKPPVLKAQRWKRKKNGEMYRYCCLISKENERKPSRHHGIYNHNTLQEIDETKGAWMADWKIGKLKGMPIEPINRYVQKKTKNLGKNCYRSRLRWNSLKTHTHKKKGGRWTLDRLTVSKNCFQQPKFLSLLSVEPRTHYTYLHTWCVVNEAMLFSVPRAWN